MELNLEINIKENDFVSSAFIFAEHLKRVDVVQPFFA